MRFLRTACLSAIGIAVFLGVIGALSGRGGPTKPSASDAITSLERSEKAVATALQDPKKVALLECNGIKVFNDPQPAGHPPSPVECAQLNNAAHLPGTPPPPPGRPDGSAPADVPDAHNAAGDPYAAGQQALNRSEYDQSKSAILEQVRATRLAVGCRVIDKTSADMMVMNSIRELSSRELNAGESDYHPDLMPAVRSEATESAAAAKQPGACDYWEQHPDAVADMRQQAQLAVSQ